MLTLPPILFGGIFTLLSAWALGSVALRRLPAPHEVRLAVGAAVLSMLVFGLALAGALDWRAVLAIGAAAMAGAYFSPGVVYRELLDRLLTRAAPKPASIPSRDREGALKGFRKHDTRATTEPEKRVLPRAAVIILAVYGVFYFVNALAPETVADGITYHLGLVREYVRTGGFPDRVAFYEMVPQGLEMLFAAAFVFGRHSAAKLVEFGLLAATLPLLMRVASRLGAPPLAGAVAAVFYFCAPVVGITGTSSYNDAGQVFFALAAFYLLLLWHESGDTRYLVPAGLLAGFCYAIKMPGLIVPALAGAWLLAARRWRAAAIFTVAAAAAIAPWMLRSLLLTGNPFAPLLNAWFPNPYFHIATEQGLARDLRSLGGVPWWGVPWQLAIGDRLTGSYGPLLLAAPVAILSWRTRAGRLCCALAAALVLPWFTNTGARFIMLAVPFLALGVGMGAAALGRGAAWTAIALQAVLCFPPVIDLYETRYGFSLHEFPLSAALRLEPEEDYLEARLDDYKMARLLEQATPPGARILALLPVATAYLDRDVRVFWQSAEADRLLDTLRVAAFYHHDTLFEVRAAWPARPLRAVRVRLPRSNPNEWCVHEFDLYSETGAVAPGRNWTLNAWPNPWEMPLAFDRNLATRWRTWEPMRAGMFVEVDLDVPQRLNGATVLSHTPVFGAPMEFFGQTPEGGWIALPAPRIGEAPGQDPRRAAVHALHAAGFQYLLVPGGQGGNGPIGKRMVGREVEWGLEPVKEAGTLRLYRVP